MRPSIPILPALVLASWLQPLVAAQAAEPRGPAPSVQEHGDGTINGKYIVVFEDSVENPGQLTDQLRGEHGFQPTHRYSQALKGFAAPLSPAAADALSRNPRVAFVAPDRTVQAVGTVPMVAGDSAPTGIRRIEAATTTAVHEASPVNVAVIDTGVGTGVDLSHPDLNVVAGKNCVGSGSPADDNGHGTHVAGTIAAENNGSGVVGVSPGTDIYAVKVLGANGSGSSAQVICGIDWVTSTRTDGNASNDISVANMSLGGTGPSLASCSTTTDAEHEAICNSTAAGVTYVVAAGNEARGFDTSSQPKVPAVYPEVLTVTAMGDSDGQPGGLGPELPCYAGEPDDEWAVYSNWAVTSTGIGHTVAGPGTCIESTVPGSSTDVYSGTSMATPHVAGVVALCLGEGATPGPCSGLTPAQIVQKIRTIAQDHATAVPGSGFVGDPGSPVSSRYYGYLAWEGMSPPTPPPPDTAAPTVASVSPTNGAPAVAPSTTISATFSEPMNTATAEAAFSLATSGASATAVGGTFSWAGNSMTFTPANPLAEKTAYTAVVGTGAEDAAGNHLAAEESWSFTTAAAPTTLAPSGTTISSGSLRSGTAAGLATDDNVYYEVNSTTSSTYKAIWYGSFAGVPNDLTTLTAGYSGKSSRSCTQDLRLWNWATGSWVEFDSRSVGTTEVLVEKSPGGTLADYVSGSSGPGELRMRARCTTSSGTFFTSADLMRISFTAPPDVTAPTITSVSPTDGATGAATSAKVSSAFSEAMNTSTAEAAFSLAGPGGTSVGGTFSWAGNTMNFTPSAPLAEATAYTATVGTGAQDPAGNPLAGATTWSFTTGTGPPPPTALAPSSTTISKGSLRSGTAANLGADDDVYYEVNSNTSSTKNAEWYGTITGMPNDLTSLTVRYTGKNSRSCTQRLYIRNWTNGNWVQLDSRSVGTTEVLVEKVPTGTLADYVSGSSGPGELRLRVQCKTSSGSFFTSGDLMTASYTTP